MMWPYYDGTGWIWMTLTMVIFWGGLIALAVWAIRAFTAPRRDGGGDQALQTLRKRLASGEITQEEFERTRKLLQS